MAPAFPYLFTGSECSVSDTSLNIHFLFSYRTLTFSFCKTAGHSRTESVFQDTAQDLGAPEQDSPIPLRVSHPGCGTNRKAEASSSFCTCLLPGTVVPADLTPTLLRMERRNFWCLFILKEMRTFLLKQSISSLAFLNFKNLTRRNYLSPEGGTSNIMRGKPKGKKKKSNNSNSNKKSGGTFKLLCKLFLCLGMSEVMELLYRHFPVLKFCYSMKYCDTNINFTKL